uniref:Uncharacterized protein n=1 Tax=Anguilla anguilla TaxID=7936 RepID=A0A0E9R8M1_ANGAN
MVLDADSCLIYLTVVLMLKLVLVANFQHAKFCFPHSTGRHQIHC